MKKALFQLQFELPVGEQYTERGSDGGAKLYLDIIDDKEVRDCLHATSAMSLKQLVKWAGSYPESENVTVIPFTTRTPEALAYRLEGRKPKLVYVMRPLHTIEELNPFLYNLNWMLDDGAIVCIHTMTSSLKSTLNSQRYPWGISHIVNAWNYLWHRVCPKLALTRNIYFALTRGKNRSFHRVEGSARRAVQAGRVLRHCPQGQGTRRRC